MEGAKVKNNRVEKRINEVWRYILKYNRKYRKMPDVSLISIELGIHSTDKVFTVLKHLTEEGYLVHPRHGVYEIRR